MTRCCEGGEGVRSQQPFRVRFAELAEVDAAPFRAAADEEEEVAAIGQELWEVMATLLRRLDACDGCLFTAVGRDAENRPARIVGEQDDPVAIPCAADRDGALGRQRLHRAAVDIHALQLRAGKKPDRTAVR